MGATVLIAGARIAVSATRSERRNIEIRGGRIAYCDHGGGIGLSNDLDDYLLLPGLINAHDHLEFNLFPRLGRRTYANATEWARDIHHPDQSPVAEHLSVPKRDRLMWGGLRNLLSGATTVSHHNPYDAAVFDEMFPVRVVRRFGWAHSLTFSRDAAARYRATPRDYPFIIHAGEGIDDRARGEVVELERLGMLGSRTVIVHGVAVDGDGFKMLGRHKSSIVWCPSSNLLTYGRTLSHARARPAVRVALGTDSAISAAGDMADELRIAHFQCGATLESLYEMVTDRAADILRLGRGAGTLHDGAAADLIAVRDRGQTPAEALVDLVPELVIVRGRIHLISKALRSRLRPTSDGFRSIKLEGRGEWLTPFDVPRLIRDARAALGPEIRLAGKQVWG